MARVRDISLTTILCLAGIGLSTLLFGPQIARTFTGANDFTGFYTAGKLAFSPDLYHVQSFMRAQGNATGLMSDQILFVRLPWQAVAFAPLTLLPFPAAHIAWTLICIVAVFAFAACFPTAPLAARAIAICWTIPVFIAIVVGQDIPLVLAALGAGFLLIDRDWQLLGGLCISLGMAKPHLLWPLALVFFWHRMWRVCAGGAIGSAALLIVSFLSGGADWIQRCLLVMRYADQHARLIMMPTLHTALLTVAHGNAIEIAVALALLAAILRGATWKQSAAIALTVGIVLGRHAFMADCALLLPALFLSWNDRRARAVFLVLISPLTFVPGIFFNIGWVVVVLSAGVLALTVPHTQKDALANK
jgi:hypothetical protein